MTTEPENLTEKAIYSALTGFAPLTALLGTADVYLDLAPASATRDVCIFNLMAGVDFDERPGYRKYQLDYQIKGVSSHSPARAGSISNEIYNRMQAMGEQAPGTALTVAGFKTLWQGRIRPVRFRDAAPEGNVYYHAGGFYRFILEETS